MNFAKVKTETKLKHHKQRDERASLLSFYLTEGNDMFFKNSTYHCTTTEVLSKIQNVPGSRGSLLITMKLKKVKLSL
jgi:hypothetical protein